MATSSVGLDATVQRLWIFGDGGSPWSFDAVIRESHHSELTVTDNPVETGVVISDHAYMAPLRVEIEAAIGDVWLDAKGVDGNRVSDTWASPSGRSVNAFAMLQNLQASAVPFSIQTGLKLYANMLVTSLDADQDVATASMLRFRATLREVKFVSTRTKKYPPRKDAKTQRQASKVVNAGEKKTTPITDKGVLQLIAYQSFEDPLKAFSSMVDLLSKAGGE